MLVAALIAALGLALAVWGFRGRRVGTYPVCGRCGFDLSGVYPGSDCCPECGAKANVRRGSRRRRPVVAVLGLILILLGAGSLALVSYANATRYDLNRLKPDWWLVMQARASSDPKVVDELIRRLKTSNVSAVAAAFLVDRALAEQDGGKAWFGTWDAVFDAAKSKGFVTDGQYQDFARRAVVREFEHRAAVRRGVPWRLGSLVTAVRVSPAAGISEDCRPQRVFVGDTLLWTNPEGGNPSLMPLSPRAATSWRQIAYTLPGIDLPPGRYALRIEASRHASGVLASGPVELLNDSVEVTGTIEVLAPDAKTVESVTDDSLRARVGAAVAVRPLRLFIDGNTRYTWGAVDVDEPPIDLAFDIYWRKGDREWLVGRFGVDTRERAVQPMGGREFPLDGLESGPVDVILRPSPLAAETGSAIDIRRAWGEEIVFENMPVEVIDQRKPPAGGG